MKKSNHYKNDLKKFFLLVTVINLLLVSCGKTADTKESEEDSSWKTEESSQSEANSQSGQEQGSQENFENKDTTGELKDKLNLNLIQGELKAEKISTFKVNGELCSLRYTPADESVLYKNVDGLYGIATVDGKHDTGAIYKRAENIVGDMYLVSHMNVSDAKNTEELNSCGIINGKGEVIIPEEYAMIKLENEYYFYTVKVTEQTDSDDYLVYITNKLISFAAGKEDVKLTGIWNLHNVTTGEKIPGATGTKQTMFSCYGKYISFYDDNKNEIKIDYRGKAWPECREMFRDGSYRKEEEQIGTVYDSEGKVLFSYNPDELSLLWVRDDFYVACKKGKELYCLINREGKIVSADFTTSNINIRGNLIEFEDRLYDFQKNAVFPKAIKEVNYIDQTLNCYIIKYSNQNVYMLEDGTVLFSGGDKDWWTDSDAPFCVKNNGFFYDYTQKSFSISADKVLHDFTLLAGNEDKTQNVIDTLTGETLISGYSQYYYKDGDGFYYIYAVDKEGNVTLYKITFLH